jgi:thiamine biosynthesis lipoprotein
MTFNKIFSLLFISILISACNSSQKYEFQGNALGTSYSVNYYSNTEKNIELAFDSIFNVINSSLSTYVKDSDISKLNDGEIVVLDHHFQNVFNSSKDIYSKTDGYFDPSIGILVNAYGFGPVKAEFDLNQNNIDSVMSFVGLDKFKLSKDKFTEKPKHFFLDFNAIAKGYTVDVLARYLEEQSITDYFVELGGEIVASGINVNSQKPWKFGIEKPIDENRTRELSYAINLKDKALATSGNYRKFRTDSLTGKKFVHTINPKTGLASKSDVLSASVVADNCMIADAYATAFMAMGFEKAKTVVEKQNLSVLLIYVDAENNIQTYVTKDLEKQISEF